LRRTASWYWLDRLAGFALVEESHPEIEVGLGKIRFETGRFLKLACRVEGLTLV
jgi:hypothetical protein